MHFSPQTWEGIPMRMGTEKGFSVQRDIMKFAELTLKKRDSWPNPPCALAVEHPALVQ